MPSWSMIHSTLSFRLSCMHVCVNFCISSHIICGEENFHALFLPACWEQLSTTRTRRMFPPKRAFERNSKFLAGKGTATSFCAQKVRTTQSATCAGPTTVKIFKKSTRKFEFRVHLERTVRHSMPQSAHPVKSVRFGRFGTFVS